MIDLIDIMRVFGFAAEIASHCDDPESWAIGFRESGISVNGMDQKSLEFYNPLSTWIELLILGHHVSRRPDGLYDIKPFQQTTTKEIKKEANSSKSNEECLKVYKDEMIVVRSYETISLQAVSELKVINYIYRLKKHRGAVIRSSDRLE